MTYRNNYEDYLAEQNALFASRPVIETGIFHHDCSQATCDNSVVWDDEPYCFTHSPDSGPRMRGYSALRAAQFSPCRWCRQLDCSCM